MAQEINLGRVRGPQGEQGPQGIQGVQGPAGPQGEQGPAADPSEIQAMIAAAVTQAKAEARREAVPPGTIWMWGGKTLPDPDTYGEWAWCDGGTNNRTTYAGLFRAIGTAFGAGNGSSTFNRPDYRERFPRGCAAAGAGTTGGSDTHSHELDDEAYAKLAVTVGSFQLATARVTTPAWSETVQKMKLQGTHDTMGSSSYGIGLGGESGETEVVPAYLSTPFIIKVS